MIMDWRFADPPETVVLTLERILQGVAPLLLVTHDAEDGGWQFLDGEQVFEQDGTTVLLGEMIQFDGSLENLADLPRGWHAWRVSPGAPWQQAPGEPADAGDPPADEQSPGTEPARNVEIKARVDDFMRLKSAAAALGEGPVECLDQQDVFFAVPAGRLKLRRLKGAYGELIHYERPDLGGPKVSRYLIAPTTNPEALEAILARVLPVAGTVTKKRWVYRAGQTRIHLDQVENLGDFVELEVVLRPDQTEAEGEAIALDLMNRLGIRAEQLVQGAYIDLPSRQP